MRCFCLAAQNYRRIMNAEELRRLRDSREASRAVPSAATVPATPVSTTPPNRLLFHDEMRTPSALITPSAMSTPQLISSPTPLAHSRGSQAYYRHSSHRAHWALSRTSPSWREVRASDPPCLSRVRYFYLPMSLDVPLVPSNALDKVAVAHATASPLPTPHQSPHCAPLLASPSEGLRLSSVPASNACS